MNTTTLPRAQQFSSEQTYRQAVRLATKAWMMFVETGSEAALKASRKMFTLASTMKNARFSPVIYIQDYGIVDTPVLVKAGKGGEIIRIMWKD